MDFELTEEQKLADMYTEIRRLVIADEIIRRGPEFT